MVVGEELKVLVTSAGVRTTSNQGRVHTWTNNPNGTLDAMYLASGETVRASGQWRIAANDSLCVEIAWRDPTSWCRFVFKVGNRYLGVASASEESSPAYEMEFAK